VATVLLCWELGGGQGHLAKLLPFAQGLSQAGHTIHAALRDLSNARQVLSGLPISYLQAPLKTRRDNDRVRHPRSFAHVLHNTGFGRIEELRAMASAWRHLIELTQPDMVVCEHSPMALLAARGIPVRRVVVGTGFSCPPDVSPLPDLRSWLGNDPETLRHDEDVVLRHANAVLQDWGETPLERISRLYHPADETFLFTFKELDNYASSERTEYWGPVPNIRGSSPVWPDLPGKRVYAYLKLFPALPQLLAALNKFRCPTLVVADGIDESTQHRFQSESLHFLDSPLDLAQVGTQCDLAILNGNHGTTVSMLMAGVPILQIPIALEQVLNSAAVIQMGAGLSASPTRPERLETTLDSLLQSDSFSTAARQFSQRYQHYNAESQAEGVMARLLRLLA